MKKQPQVSVAYCFQKKGVQIAYYHEEMDEPKLIDDGYPIPDGLIPTAMCRLYERGVDDRAQRRGERIGKKRVSGAGCALSI